MTDETTVLKHIKRQKEAASRRSQFEHHWDDLTRVLLPRRQGFTTTTEAGEQRLDDVYVGTPMQAA